MSPDGLCAECERRVEALLRSPLLEGPRPYAEVRPDLQASLDAVVGVLDGCMMGVLPESFWEPAMEARRSLFDLLDVQDTEQAWLAWMAANANPCEAQRELEFEASP